MYAKVNSLGLFGLNAFPVEIEIDLSRGQPSFDIVGLPDMVVKESRERIKSALNTYLIKFPTGKAMVNLAPANTKKSGSVHDLGILVAILKVTGFIRQDLDDSAFIGEISLNGSVRKITGVLPMVLLARKLGLKRVYVPYENAYEASAADDIEVYGVKNISEIIEHFSGRSRLMPQERFIPSEISFEGILDFSDVKGQESAKKAIETAVAGGHNILMIGTPGSGKSMLAKRIPSILPPMTFEESIETTNVYSISGMLSNDVPLITQRPFRSPHHTISSAGLTGGGTIPRPGEISLAHNGVLFLDELGEFDRRTLDILRQPLEDGIVTISRAAGSVTYPCSVMLVAAMNPCPCGYYGHPSRKCICGQKKAAAYVSKISGPMLDRFDIHIEVPPVEFTSLSNKRKSENSAEIRKRVEISRKIQKERFKNTNISCNADITPDKLQLFCPLTDKASATLEGVFTKLGMSARAYERILKVSRTIADTDCCEVINEIHIAQAIAFRSLDRKYWSCG